MNHHEAPRGATVEWYTPKALFDALALEFELDVASPLAGPVPWVPARGFLTAREDGRMAPWRGLVWCNPPYGEESRRFAYRMIEHGDGVLLLPARTETVMAQRLLREAGTVCFLAERLEFVRADGYQWRAPHGSILFAFGAQARRAVEFSNLGVVWSK